MRLHILRRFETSNRAKPHHAPSHKVAYLLHHLIYYTFIYVLSPMVNAWSKFVYNALHGLCCCGAVST